MTAEEGFIEIQVIPGAAFSWESQAMQYAVYGEPGIGYEVHWLDLESGNEVFPLNNPEVELDEVGEPVGTTKIDCLLHRGEDGLLDGILNRYDGKNPIEQADSINVWVRPDRQRHGIATKLVKQARFWWAGITYDKQRYTENGVELLRHLLGEDWQ